MAWPDRRSQQPAAKLRALAPLRKNPPPPLQVDIPVYCATKAALHSFTLSMRDLERRRALEGLPAAAVVEIAPPAVNTDLGGPGLHDHGVPLDAFADSVMRVGLALVFGSCLRRAFVAGPCLVLAAPNGVETACLASLLALRECLPCGTACLAGLLD